MPLCTCLSEYCHLSNIYIDLFFQQLDISIVLCPRFDHKFHLIWESKYIMVMNPLMSPLFIQAIVWTYIRSPVHRVIWYCWCKFDSICGVGLDKYLIRLDIPLWHTLNKQILLKLRYHADVIKWKYFPCYWPFERGIQRSPVNSPHKDQWRRALMFPSISAWANKRDAGDLVRHRAHDDVILMNLRADILFMKCSHLMTFCI